MEIQRELCEFQKGENLKKLKIVTFSRREMGGCEIHHNSIKAYKSKM